MGARSQAFNRFITANFGGSLGEQVSRVYLPGGLLKTTGLAPGMALTLKLGSLNSPVTVEQVHCSGGTEQPIFFISPDLFERCQLPIGHPLTLKYNPAAGIVSAGPLIGLFTVRNVLVDSEFGSQEPTLAALTNSGAGLSGLVIVFCPEDLDWDAMTVTGYIPACEDTGDFTWKPLRLPIPDVIYDRIPSRSVELRPAVQEAKSRFTVMDTVSYFNPMFLNKWETHTALVNIPEVAGYLPPTWLVESPEDILTCLHTYGSVFLKPSLGSLGCRIIKVALDQNGMFKFMYRSKERQTVQGAVSNFPALNDLLRPVMGKRLYVVQKDLQLAAYEGCPFDIRILAQKDRYGNWRRTKIYARIAAPDSFLSNLSDGGHPKPLSTVLAEVFNVNFQARTGLGEEIRTAVSRIPPALEKGTGMIWGELGIDLGIDLSGKIWLIEINSKPFRALVTESGAFKVIERSLMRPLEYAKYLAGFYRHAPAVAPRQPVPVTE